jgi:methylated-DNA-[protein]-cysteine S-methyltransferase
VGQVRTRQTTPAALLKTTCEQLKAYFDGTLEKFNLPVALSHTDFRRRVWTVMADIPYGSAHACG